MKYYFAVTLLIVLVGCSQTPNKNNISSSNQASSNSANEPPLGRPNLPDDTPNTQSASTPQMAKEYAEAQDVTDKFWQTVIAKCNSDFYFVTYNSNSRANTFYDCKHMSGPETTMAQLNSPRALSEAERLNGVDPLPIIFEGKSIVTLQTCREWHQGFGDSWSGWFDLTHEITLQVTKKKSGWTTFTQGWQLLRPTCENIRIIDQRYKGQ